MKIYKILGQEGRITVPYDIRLAMRLDTGSLVSFELAGKGVAIRKEKICDDCAGKENPEAPTLGSAETDGGEAAETPLLTYLDSLTATEQMAALIHLTGLWARERGEGKPK